MLVPVVVQIVFVGCDAADTRSRDAEADSAGITIITNQPPYPAWQLADSPLVRVGVREGDAPYQLHDVRFAARLSDGRIMVVDGGSQEVRWYSSAGTHRSTLGRRGAGPGEFGNIRSAVVTRGDSVVIMDLGNQRLVWISPEEAVVREHVVSGFGTSDKRVLGVAMDGRVRIANYRYTYNVARPGFNPTRDSLVLLLYSTAGVDSVARIPGDETSTWVQFDSGRPSRMMQWGLGYGYPTLTGANQEHFIVAHGEHAQVEMLDSSGAITRILRRAELGPTPVTPADRDQFVRYWVEDARRRGVRDVTEVEQGRRDEMQALSENHSVPAFDRLLVDAEGRVWLRDYAPVWWTGPVQLWTIYDSLGHVLARASIPTQLVVTHVGLEHVTGVERDELDVETVVVYHIDRS